MSQGQERSAIGRELDFVGRVTASATHEIKNELAVINEQSRLVLEFLEMAAKGKEISLERLHELVSRVVVRVGQADQVVKRLNTFAHSTELERSACEAVAVVQLMVQMFARLAGLKRVGLELEPGHPAAVELPAAPLVVEQAVWAALGAALEAAASGSSLKLSLAPAGGALRLSIRGEMSAAPALPAAELLGPLGAKATAEAGALYLEIPLKADAAG